MPKNIIICCDGTGNEIENNLSNVLKLYRVVQKTSKQIVFYDPGVGTLSDSGNWAKIKNDAKGVFGLATGYGLDENVLEAYRFLVQNYKDGDNIYLFGFSRGAYTVRVLAGFLYLIGLLKPEQINLSSYALVAYKQSSEQNELRIGWRFQQVTDSQHVPIRFMGVWDTVGSVIVPRPDRFYFPSMQILPYTKNNPSVQVFRQAIAIDERRRMFRLSRWDEPQSFKSNPFVKGEKIQDQDIKQVWFSGVHTDIGGGYTEEESGLAKFPLKWMIDEAMEHGMLIKKAMFNRLVLGKNPSNAKIKYVAPNSTAEMHQSMNWGWQLLEWVPKRDKWKDWPKRQSFLGRYIPNSEPRFIPDNAEIHESVEERMNADPDYRPVNLP